MEQHRKDPHARVSDTALGVGELARAIPPPAVKMHNETGSQRLPNLAISDWGSTEVGKIWL